MLVAQVSEPATYMIITFPADISNEILHFYKSGVKNPGMIPGSF
jgi:hypothetical protein